MCSKGQSFIVCGPFSVLSPPIIEAVSVFLPGVPFMWKYPCLVDLFDDNKQETSERMFPLVGVCIVKLTLKAAPACFCLPNQSNCFFPLTLRFR